MEGSGRSEIQFETEETTEIPLSNKLSLHKEPLNSHNIPLLPNSENTFTDASKLEIDGNGNNDARVEEDVVVTVTDSIAENFEEDVTTLR